MRMLIASTALVFGFATGLAPGLTQAAPDTFNVAFNVERIDAAKLSIDRCAEIAQQEAATKDIRIPSTERPES